ncbi:MAG: hypothetical protein WC679_13210 [Bacteroidales bacterium]|jgi:plasmid maintenance system antidote protein VapI
MKMQEYLDLYSLNAYDLAKMCKVSHTVIYKIIKGSPVTQRVADKINKRTNDNIDLEIYTPHSKGGGRHAKN